MSKKRLFISILFLAIFVAIFLYFKNPKQAEAPVSNFEIKKEFEFENKIINSKQSQKYNIEFEYPFFKGESQSETKINKDIKDFGEKYIEDNIKNFDEMLSDSNLEDSTVIEDLSLIAKYTVSQNLKFQTINVMYEVYVYSGGAHGITNISYMVFDMKTGNRLSLQDVFTSKAKALAELSRLFLLEIKKIDQDLEIYVNAEEGTLPVEDNFINFALDPSGFKIKFSDYQVGPYVAGRLEITLPYEKLKDLLKEEFKK